MMELSLFQIAVSIAAGAVSFIAARIWSIVSNLQARDIQIAEKLSQLELLVVGNYVKRSEFDAIVKLLFEKLDKIDEKLSQKADK